jgi:hypothetical protein
MFGSRVTGTVGMTDGLGPPDAGKGQTSAVRAGSGPSTDERQGPIGMSPGIGPTRRWWKGTTIGAGTKSMAADPTSAVAATGAGIGVATGVTIEVTTAGIPDAGFDRQDA